MTQRRLTADEVDDLCFLYRAGYGMIELSDKYGVTIQSVRYHLIKHDQPIRAVGRRSPRSQFLYDTLMAPAREATEAEIEARAHQTCAECGKQFGSARRKVICYRKRCRQQREYKNRTTDPIRHEKMKANGRAPAARRRVAAATI